MSATHNRIPDSPIPQTEQPHLRPWRAIYFDDGEVGFNWRDTNTFRMGYRWRNVTPSSKARVRRMMAAMHKLDVPMWEHAPRFMPEEYVWTMAAPGRAPYVVLTGRVIDYNAFHDGRIYDYGLDVGGGRIAYRNEDEVFMSESEARAAEGGDA